MTRRRLPLLALALFGLALTAAEPVLPAAMPPLQWVNGWVKQILVQPKENYYSFLVQTENGATALVRICDPYTGAAGPMTANSPEYDLLKEAYFRDLRIEVGARSFGLDPQAGSQKNCVDRVSLFK